MRIIVDLFAEGKGEEGGFFTVEAIGEETPSLNDLSFVSPFSGDFPSSFVLVSSIPSIDEVDNELLNRSSSSSLS